MVPKPRELTKSYYDLQIKIPIDRHLRKIKVWRRAARYFWISLGNDKSLQIFDNPKNIRQSSIYLEDVLNLIRTK